SLKVVGRLPEQTRAFFLGRGFPDKAARRFSESCVIHVTLRNLGDSGLSYRLGRWRVRLPDNAHPPEAEADWEARWRRMGVPKRGRTAFDWSMFPPEENLGAEGWALGMVSLGLKPGRHFDLVAHWRRDGQPHKVVMKDLVCPANGTKTSTR
ncbi:MAG TPA: hypothetical protein VKA48_01835, partial [Gammaproteobacteria bacterium]|nr:hypothetical protein [Gammaproteobacteria bacterium]